MNFGNLSRNILLNSDLKLWKSLSKFWKRYFLGGKLRSTVLGLRPSMSWLRIAVVLCLLYAYGILIFYLCISSVLGPAKGPSTTEEVVRISPGMSAMEIGEFLTRKGFVRNAFLFQLASLLNGTSRSLKAGEYSLNRSMSVFQILRKIASGEVVLYSFTIPEGFTSLQIAGLWEEKGFGTEESFMEASRDHAISEKYGIVSNSLEGYLFPDTYMFPYDIAEREAIGEMLRQSDKNVSELMKDAATVHHTGNVDADFTRHEIISLASIIEKEAKVEYEKPIISAVFHNRLRRGRRLESCATVLYSLGYPDRKLTAEDLKNTRSPYNTYIHKGLPPGPICNPGRGSIAAAVNPSKDRYLYFVSKNDGTHYFTESYEDFVNAKQRYKDG